MEVKLSVSYDGKIKITTGSDKVRIDDLKKFLARNDDAMLVKLEGPHDPSMTYKPGHVCRIEEDDENDQQYNVFVGKHYIGYLPDEALTFADQIDYTPDCFVSIVGKTEGDDIYIYVAS